MGAGSSTEAEREPLLVPSRVGTNTNTYTNGLPVNSRVYGRRWLVLTLFSLLALMQGMVWNFWGPIANSAVQAYGFTKSDIAFLVLWGPVGYIPWLLFMWLMDKKGLRISLLLSAFFMLLGSALRSVPVTDLHLRRWLIHGGQFLNGLAGPTVMSAGPYLSTTWFAPDQRATATAVASLFSYLGGATSFIVGPLIVPAPNVSQAAAVSNTSIQSRTQLILYAGTNRKRKPLKAWRIDSTSFQHHVIPVEGQEYNQATGIQDFCTDAKSSSYNPCNCASEK